MALRKRGKNGCWHAYFRTVTALPDGRLKYATTTVNLGTSDLVTARAMEAQLMAKNKAARLHQRATAVMTRLEIAAGERVPTPEEKQLPSRTHRRKRLKLKDWYEAITKYREISKDGQNIFNRFVDRCTCTYFDEVTSEIALTYLQTHYGAPGKGKSFNNNKTTLNTIFRFLLIDAGMSESPFARIPNRKHTAEHQRPFTEEEFARIYTAAQEPWKTASLIAWHTGLREESVFKLRWSDIEGDVLTILPGKTARFGRAVRIPIHPQLQAHLSTLPRENDYVLGCFSYNRRSGAFSTAFGKLLDSLDIRSTPGEIVNFNCFRDSFVTRCDAAGIPRHAVRGVVGHVSDDTTDLYSHDLQTARLIQHLPPAKLEKPD